MHSSTKAPRIVDLRKSNLEVVRLVSELTYRHYKAADLLPGDEAPDGGPESQQTIFHGLPHSSDYDTLGLWMR